jgi:hypothetical protein
MNRAPEAIDKLRPVKAYRVISRCVDTKLHKSSINFNLTQEQRFIIKEVVFKDLHVPKARADAPETIGGAVPKNIDLHPMPPVLADKVPQGRSHSFFVKGDNVIVLVSPNDHRVADVIR